ncbi:TonB-dependent siderophore receptor, partial [Acinetobacter baumannii]
DRVQFTIGARHQMAGTEVLNYLPPAPGVGTRPYQETSVLTPAYAILVKPVENISVYANYVEGLQTPQVVTGANFRNLGQIFPPNRTMQVE